MLLLVAADGDKVGLVEQDIRGHERGIGEQAGVDIIRIFGRLILELRHAGKLAEHGVAVEHPAELRVRGDVALDEQSVLFRVKTAGDVLRELRKRAAAQIGRHLPDGDGVHVYDAVVAFIFIGERYPVFDRPHIRAERKIAGGLYAGEYDFFAGSFFHDDSFLS